MEIIVFDRAVFLNIGADRSDAGKVIDTECGRDHLLLGVPFGSRQRYAHIKPSVGSSFGYLAEAAFIESAEAFGKVFVGLFLDLERSSAAGAVFFDA